MAQKLRGHVCISAFKPLFKLSSLDFAAPEKPKPAKSGIRDLTAVKEALNASSDADKKPAVRETNGAVQTINVVATTEANPPKAVTPETDRNATGGVEQAHEKEGGGKEKTEDHDLDAYLMGALDDDGGSSDRSVLLKHFFIFSILVVVRWRSLLPPSSDRCRWCASVCLLFLCCPVASDCLLFLWWPVAFIRWKFRPKVSFPCCCP
jgi:hypothetical protein